MNILARDSGVIGDGREFIVDGVAGIIEEGERDVGDVVISRERGLSGVLVLGSVC